MNIEHVRKMAQLLPNSNYPRILEAYEYAKDLLRKKHLELRRMCKDLGMLDLYGFNKFGTMTRLIEAKFGMAVRVEVEDLLRAEVL